MSEREEVKTIRHFVDKATKWDEGSSEYAHGLGVYDVLDKIEAALAARDAGAGVILSRIRPTTLAEEFEAAPCFACGYNGGGYFSADTHPCATMYHSGDWSALVDADAAGGREDHLATEVDRSAPRLGVAPVLYYSVMHAIALALESDDKQEKAGIPRGYRVNDYAAIAAEAITRGSKSAAPAALARDGGDADA